jgi:hypothetical protein
MLALTAVCNDDSPYYQSPTKCFADENREKVVESGCIHGFLIDCLKHDAVLPFAIAAILNVCVDYGKVVNVP